MQVGSVVLDTHTHTRETPPPFANPSISCLEEARCPAPHHPPPSTPPPILGAGGTLPDEVVATLEERRKKGLTKAGEQALRNHQKVKNWTKVGGHGWVDRWVGWCVFVHACVW